MKLRIKAKTYLLLVTSLIATGAIPAVGADLIVINNGSSPPNPVNVINAADGSTYADALIHVHNLGCDGSVNPCATPGNPTTVTVEEGAGVGSSVVAFESSVIEMTGGSVGGIFGAIGNARAALKGGVVGGNLGCSGTATCIMSGGSVSGNVGGSDASRIEWRGGQASGTVFANDAARIVIVGSGFAVDGVTVPPGVIASAAGTLTGTLASGDSVNNAFRHRGADALATGLITLSPTRFQGLGALPGAGSSNATAVSGDGKTAVGTSGSAFRWTREDGMQELPPLAGGTYSDANSVSGDGSVVVGGSGSSTGYQAFSWTVTGSVGLGDLPGGGTVSVANSVSGDGSVIVGRGNSDLSSEEAFLWTEEGGFVGLGVLPGGFLSSSAWGVSAAGNVVVGDSSSGGITAGFIWTADDGMVPVGDLPGGAFYSSARAVSGDGLVVAGSSSSDEGNEAFRWTDAEGMTGLGFLPGATESNSEILGASFDGSVLVGGATSESGGAAVVWTNTGGLRKLEEILEEEFGEDLSGWTLLQANDVSYDGSTIVGVGTNPDGEQEAWIAYVPEAAGPIAPLVALAALSLLKALGLAGGLACTSKASGRRVIPQDREILEGGDGWARKFKQKVTCEDVPIREQVYGLIQHTWDLHEPFEWLEIVYGNAANEQVGRLRSSLAARNVIMTSREGIDAVREQQEEDTLPDEEIPVVVEHMPRAAEPSE